jgi:hypothetical protein
MAPPHVEGDEQLAQFTVPPQPSDTVPHAASAVHPLGVQLPPPGPPDPPEPLPQAARSAAQSAALVAKLVSPQAVMPSMLG